MSTVEGLFVIGEANFSDHGANRLGASALMQGLADGYFVLPYTIGDYLAQKKGAAVGTDHAAFKKTEADVNGTVKKTFVYSRQALTGFVPPRTRENYVGLLRYVAHRRGT
jgi:succinate dehydrogenase/fumarate reductase flavoprotein subunit